MKLQRPSCFKTALLVALVAVFGLQHVDCWSMTSWIPSSVSNTVGSAVNSATNWIPGVQPLKSLYTNVLGNGKFCFSSHDVQIRLDH